MNDPQETVPVNQMRQVRENYHLNFVMYILKVVPQIQMMIVVSHFHLLSKSKRMATGQGSQGKVRENDTKMLKSQGNFKANQFFSCIIDFCHGRSNCLKSVKNQGKVREIDIEHFVANLNIMYVFPF